MTKHRKVQIIFVLKCISVKHAEIALCCDLHTQFIEEREMESLRC